MKKKKLSTTGGVDSFCNWRCKSWKATRSETILTSKTKGGRKMISYAIQYVTPILAEETITLFPRLSLRSHDIRIRTMNEMAHYPLAANQSSSNPC